MNKYIVTAQILFQIKLRKKGLILTLLYVPNNKKKISFFKLLINIDNNLCNEIFQLYKINDIFTIEGTLHNVKYVNNKHQLFLNIEIIALNI